MSARSLRSVSARAAGPGEITRGMQHTWPPGMKEKCSLEQVWKRAARNEQGATGREMKDQIPSHLLVTQLGVDT